MDNPIEDTKPLRSIMEGLRKSIGNYVVVGTIGGAKLMAVYEDGISLRGADGTKLFLFAKVLTSVADNGAIQVVPSMPPGGPQGVVGRA